MNGPQQSRIEVNDISPAPRPKAPAPPDAPDPRALGNRPEAAGGPADEPGEWEPDEFAVERGGYGVATDI